MFRSGQKRNVLSFRLLAAMQSDEEDGSRDCDPSLRRPTAASASVKFILSSGSPRSRRLPIGRGRCTEANSTQVRTYAQNGTQGHTHKKMAIAVCTHRYEFVDHTSRSSNDRAKRKRHVLRSTWVRVARHTFANHALPLPLAFSFLRAWLRT